MPTDPLRRSFLRDRVGPLVNLPVQLLRRGLIRPGPPGRIARQLAALHRWGTTLAGEFLSAAARDPDRIALIDERGPLTYADVDARTGRLAAAFARLTGDGSAVRAHPAGRADHGGTGRTGASGGAPSGRRASGPEERAGGPAAGGTPAGGTAADGRGADAAGARGTGAAGAAERRPRVAVLCRNHRGMVETLIACAKLGADVVLLNVGMGVDRLLEVIERQRVNLLVADAEFHRVLDEAPAGVRTVVAAAGDAADGTDGRPAARTGGCAAGRGDGSRTGDDRAEDAVGGADGHASLDALIEAQPDTDWAPPPRPGRTVILSSGTTGTPKGARRPPRPGLRALAAILSRIPLRVHDVVLIEAPLFHTWGYAAMQVTLALRGTIVLHRRFTPQAALEAVERHRCTAMFAVPVMIQRIVESPEAARDRHDTSSLRVVALSGSALPGGLATAFMDAFGDVLYNLYGSTEASWVSIATPRDLRASPGTAGRPPPGTVVAVLGPDGEPLPPGRTGRIFAANEAMFEGYTGGETVERRHGLIGLGDVGHLDASGRLFVAGRDDDMVVSGGENIFPREVEDVLADLPQVREVAVIGVPDAEFGQRLAAYVVRNPGMALDADAVRAQVRRRLARYAVPRDVHFLDELPRNATGKVVPRLLPGADAG